MGYKQGLDSNREQTKRQSNNHRLCVCIVDIDLYSEGDETLQAVCVVRAGTWFLHSDL